MKQREIKFRVWDSIKGEMHLPQNADEQDFFISCEGDIKYQYEVGVEGHTTLGYRKDWYLMQYTGLKDKNGKDIYEGDIMKTAYGNYVVEFDMGQFQYENFDHYGVNGESPDLEEGEIIGNIYENAGLLAVAP